jgi:hypothetical protein
MRSSRDAAVEIAEGIPVLILQVGRVVERAAGGAVRLFLADKPFNRTHLSLAERRPTKMGG